MSNDDSPSNPFPTNLPPDAPEELRILAENVSAILTPIAKIRGTKYTSQLITLLILFQQSAELEAIACESTRIIRDSVRVEGETESFSLKATASIKHDSAHILADAMSVGLHRMVAFHEMIDGYDGISKDLETLVQRVKTDWKDKGH